MYKLKKVPNQIQREDAKRRIVVGFNVRGRDVQSIVEELQQKVEKQLKFPTGYYVTYGGAFENLNAAKQRLMIAVPVSFLLIFILLYFAFNSIKQGLLIYSAIPLSAIGGIISLAARGMPFSISAGVGFIALFGVAVLNGIVLIAEFNLLKKEGITDVRRIVLMGTKVRLRPVLMTAFVASLGFFPMAVSNGAGAEVQRPLATVVIGGLLLATFLTLFVLPVLYMLFEKGGKPKKMKHPIAVMILIVAGMSLSQPLLAQTPISLKAAIDTALHNNLQVKNEQLKARYQEALVGTATNLPQTNFIADLGQINSIYTDTKFSLSQSFSFPSVYTKQKALLQEEFKSAVLNVALKEAQLKKELTQVYYGIVYIEQKQALLQYTDSLYRSFYKRAEQRLAKGETNLLEKTSAETQLGQIGIQLKQLAQDQSVLLLQFQLLLNSAMAYRPSKADYRLSYQGVLDSALLKEHPSLKLIQQQQQMAEAQIGLEKSKKLPELSVGYNNTSIKGMGADNVLYGAGQRFSAVQLGIGIPIFAKSQNNRIAGAKLNKQVAESNYQVGIQSLENAYLSANLQYRKNLETLKYYEEQALKNATVITNTANQQLAAGSINYLEWFQLINQATIVRSEHIDAIRNLNESIIQLNFISNK